MDLDRLRKMDPAGWDTGLSPENARSCWSEALEALEWVDLGPVEGQAPERVLLLASANVYTVPLPWMALLSLRGVRLRVKAARGLGAATRAMASAFDLVEVEEWRGGEPGALQAASRGVDAVMAFGRQDTLKQLRHQLPPSLPLLCFGPRFSVGISAETEPLAVVDLARYDSRGCMSPAGWFTDSPDLELLAVKMEGAERHWPRGRLSVEEEVAIRGRIALAKMVGSVLQGEGWALIQLPARFFSKMALPRVLQLYPTEGVAALDPRQLSTVAGTPPLPPAPRHCLPGEMQRPAASRWHDGVDVLRCLWGQPFVEWKP